MSAPNPSTALGRVVVDELARNDVELIVISPGSRSGALAIAAAQHSGLETVVVVDERSAAFHALGRAKATGRPVAAVATSGTAPANYLPAVVEADMSQTPLIVVSADRPAELRGVGANQTIDQTGLFGSRVRLEAAIEAADGDEDHNRAWRTTVSRIAGAAKGSLNAPGPAHLNVAFREPTVPVPDDGRSRAEPYGFDIQGRTGGGPWVESQTLSPPVPDFALPETSRGLVIAGEGKYEPHDVLDLATARGWPVLATAMSGARSSGVITSYHHLLSKGVPEALRPDVVVAIGAIGPSARLEDLVASAGSRYRVDPTGRTIDPRRNATRIAHVDPAALLQTIPGAAGREFGEMWAGADSEARSAMDEYLGAELELSGAGSARALDESRWDTLVAASSLPIREIDAHLTRPEPVIANRGASGIDGFVSTSLGAASARNATVALSGDLSLLHDSNGFLCEQDADLVMVVLDNNGGGLFDSLPQAVHAPEFERLFITAHGRDIGVLADFHSLEFGEASSHVELVDRVDRSLAQGGVHLIRVGVDRERDQRVRRALDELGAGVVGLS